MMWSAMGTTGSGRWEVRSQDTQVARSLDGATGKNQGPSEGLWTQKSTAKWLWSRVDEYGYQVTSRARTGRSVRGIPRSQSREGRLPKGWSYRPPSSLNLPGLKLRL